MELSKDGQKVIGKKIRLSCDSLGVSGGWTPAVHLFTQSGGKLKFREDDQVFIPNKYPSDQLSIGSCNGDLSLEEITTNTVLSVKKFLNINNTDYKTFEITTGINKSKRNIWLLPSDKILGKTKSFVDYQNDATAKDIKLALKE